MAEPNAGSLDGVARHIILIGLPGAGKSTVGPILAARLGRPFHDMDEEITRREGRPIAEIFATSGERAFRELEERLTNELLGGPPAVISAGGGWVVSETNVMAARGLAVLIHLRVTPATATKRMGVGTGDRPLLAGVDPADAIARLWRARGERYGRAEVQVDTEVLDPERVAGDVLRLINWSVA